MSRVLIATAVALALVVPATSFAAPAKSNLAHGSYVGGDGSGAFIHFRFDGHSVAWLRLGLNHHHATASVDKTGFVLTSDGVAVAGWWTSTTTVHGIYQYDKDDGTWGTVHWTAHLER